MAPFRSLLSSKIPFHWSVELAEAFKDSKEEIVKQCVNGVRNFRPNAPTALATDWSKAAVGLWLTQKQCNCPSPIPGCCKNGWQTVYVASKFNKPAVSQYHPIEGEAYAAVWALDKCKLFVLGHPNLTLVTDHKPLLAILGHEQELSELVNPRLMNYKLKSMAFRFTPLYVPGKLHVVPDTMSRRWDSPVHSLPRLPSSPPVDNNVLPQYSDTFGPPNWVSNPQVKELSSQVEQIYVGQVTAVLETLMQAPVVCSTLQKPEVISWSNLSKACDQCPEYRELKEAVLNGFPPIAEKWTTTLEPFKKVRDNLTILDSVVMLQNRPVIPVSLRKQMLEHLHAAHSGTQAMLNRAATDLYWPGYRKDIEMFRSTCASCNLHMPSNPAEFSNPDPSMPTYPFQVIIADFFNYKGKNYLAIVDKYSNWLSVLLLQKDTSTNLIKALREYFSVFGVAEQICTDGATIFMSAELKSFFQTWAISHRVSSAYHPSSNKRAEVAVKSAKRLIRENVANNGSLNTDAFTRALMIHRNTPDASTKVSPAEIIFGHKIRDHIPSNNYTPQRNWVSMAKAREQCFLKRHYAKAEPLEMGRKKLPELQLQDRVYVQNQTGPAPKLWSKSGVIVECLPHNSYLVKIDGSGHLTRRNRQFLRKFTPYGENCSKQLNVSTCPPPQINGLIDIADKPLTVTLATIDSSLYDSTWESK